MEVSYLKVCLGRPEMLRVKRSSPKCGDPGGSDVSGTPLDFVCGSRVVESARGYGQTGAIGRGAYPWGWRFASPAATSLRRRDRPAPLTGSETAILRFQYV